jgi:hypothetical protein
MTAEIVVESPAPVVTTTRTNGSSEYVEDSIASKRISAVPEAPVMLAEEPAPATSVKVPSAVMHSWSLAVIAAATVVVPCVTCTAMAYESSAEIDQTLEITVVADCGQDTELPFSTRSL